MIHIIYHSIDMDGYMSANIILYALYCEKSTNPEFLADITGRDASAVRVTGCNYNPPLPDNFYDYLKPGDLVYIVDYSLPIEHMERIRSIAKKMVWIDHHGNVIDTYREHGFLGEQKEGYGACKLTWEYIFPGRAIPYAVEASARYDVFDFNSQNIYDPILLYSKGLNKAVDIFDGPLWKKDFSDMPLYNYFENSDRAALIELGKEWAKTTTEESTKAAYTMNYSIDTDGLTVLSVNTSAFIASGSWVFYMVDPSSYDYAVRFARGRSNVYAGLYASATPKCGHEVDVSEVARRFGGNGHAAAAGCTFQSLLSLPLWLSDVGTPVAKEQMRVLTKQ